MDSPEFQPPKPLAMSDAELEIALDNAKSSPDGLLAAMILLEQQEQLRRADAAALASWLEDQPEKQPALEEPEFDSLLDAAVHEATESLETIEDVEAESSTSLPNELEHEPDVEPLSAADLAVTGTLDQIISGVNQSFVAASESLTAEEEGPSNQSDEPLPSASIPIVSPQKRSVLGRATEYLNALPMVEYLASIATVFVAVKLGASLSTTLLALALGIVLQTSIAFMFRLNEARGSLAHSIMNRATFGVWGAHLAGAIGLLVRIVMLGAVSVWLVTALDKTTSLGDLNAASPSALGFIPNGILIPSAIALLASLMALASRLRLALNSVALVLTVIALIWVLTLGGSYAFEYPEIGEAVGLGVCYAIVTGMLARQSFNIGMSWRGATKELSSLVGVRVIPTLALTGLATFAAFTLPATLSTRAPLYEFNRSALEPLASLANFAVTFVVVSLISLLCAQLTETLRSLNLHNKGVINTLLCTVAVASPWLANLATEYLGAMWPVIVLGLVAIATTPYLTEAILRRAKFHEVSLRRSYAFYKKVSLGAILGLILFTALLVGCTPGPLRFIPVETPTWFGAATILVVIVVGIKLWTLASSLPRIRAQESELAQVEIRRNELAGLDFIE